MLLKNTMHQEWITVIYASFVKFVVIMEHIVKPVEFIFVLLTGTQNVTIAEQKKSAQIVVYVKRV